MDWLFAVTIILSFLSFCFSVLAIIIAWNHSEVHIYHEQDKD